MNDTTNTLFKAEVARRRADLAHERRFRWPDPCPRCGVESPVMIHAPRHGTYCPDCLAHIAQEADVQAERDHIAARRSQP